MAAVEVTITGMLYDKLARTTQNVVLIGEASFTGVGIGGGPIIPQPPGGDHIWGPTDPRPSPPIAFPPGWVGGVPPRPPGTGIWPNPPEGIAPHPEHPIVIPPPNAPKPPEAPSAGDPPVAVPPPPGAGGWPVQPVVPPPYIIVNYPGYGPLYVAPPASGSPPETSTP